MDTRQKIIPLHQLDRFLSTGSWLVIAGLFDPVTALEAERIAAFSRAEPGHKVVVVVLEREQSLLSVDARCALVAALRVVDLVTSAPHAGLRSTVSLDSERIRVLADPAGDSQRSQDFVELVLARQQAAS